MDEATRQILKNQATILLAISNEEINLPIDILESMSSRLSETKKFLNPKTKPSISERTKDALSTKSEVKE